LDTDYITKMEVANLLIKCRIIKENAPMYYIEGATELNDVESLTNVYDQMLTIIRNSEKESTRKSNYQAHLALLSKVAKWPKGKCTIDDYILLYCNFSSIQFLMKIDELTEMIRETDPVTYEKLQSYDNTPLSALSIALYKPQNEIKKQIESIKPDTYKILGPLVNNPIFSRLIMDEFDQQLMTYTVLNIPDLCNLM